MDSKIIGLIACGLLVMMAGCGGEISTKDSKSSSGPSLPCSSLTRHRIPPQPGGWGGRTAHIGQRIPNARCGALIGLRHTLFAGPPTGGP